MGIRVNAVAPGPVWTPLNPSDAGLPAKDVAQFGKKNPMGRPAQPEEIAPAYVFRNAALVRLEPSSWACWNGRFGDVPRIPAPVLQLYRSKHLERLPRLEAWAQLNLIKDVYPLQAAPAAPLTQDGTACGTTLSGPPAALTNPQG